MTIDQRLEALTMNLELAHRDIQDLAGAVGSLVDFVGESERRHDSEMAAIRAELRRAVRLGVTEARRARAKHREIAEITKELDQKITQLAAAQLVTEEKLQRFLDSRRGNGNPT